MRLKNIKLQLLRKQKRPHLPREAMAGTAVTQQPPMPLRQDNHVQATWDEDAAKEIVPEDAVTKDVAEEADTSIAQHTYHQ